MNDQINLEEFRKDGISAERFASFVKSQLFQNSSNKSHYSISDDKIVEIFKFFDEDQDGYLNKSEYDELEEKWLSCILKPRCALIIVDIQNDFIDGSHAIEEFPANHRDCHPDNHISFIDNIDLWKPVAVDGQHLVSKESKNSIEPGNIVTFNTSFGQIDVNIHLKHCVQGTKGVDLHQDLKFIASAKRVFKGLNPELESYSAFGDDLGKQPTELASILKSANITDVFVCGIAYDYCVRATALGANALGYRTIVIDDACRGTDLVKIQRTKQELEDKACVLVRSDQVESMVKGLDRRPELACYLYTKIVTSGN
ncbi:nicotinamide amidase [Brevipalpus obovatus]|uniref:nicotinamide amidase n=1 Tax=Brevipalpus obovatus TaxID=246614 RepID=UPI003D9EC823